MEYVGEPRLDERRDPRPPLFRQHAARRAPADGHTERTRSLARVRRRLVCRQDDLLIDYKEVYRATRATIEAYGPWAFDNQKYLILNLALGGDFPRSVNKTEKPYLGLPAATVEAIKQDGPQFLVDWVRVDR